MEQFALRKPPISHEAAMRRYAGRLESVAIHKAEMDGFIVHVDSPKHICTADLNVGRIHFFVRDGFVHEVEIG